MRYRYLFAILFLVAGLTLGRKEAKRRADDQRPLKVPSLEKTLQAMHSVKENRALVLHYGPDNDRDLFKAIASLAEQSYHHFEALLLLEESRGSIKKEILEDLDRRGLMGSVQVLAVRNQDEATAFAYERINQLVDSDFVFPLSSSDWLANEHVLELANGYFNEKTNSFILGQYVHYPTFEQGMKKKTIQRELEKGKFPKSEEFLGAAKLFRVGFLRARDPLDLFDLNDRAKLEKLVMGQKTFCRSVFYVHSTSDNH